ncbi:MAG: hypothetical protein P8X76_12940 [Maritimibacter sp.]
MQNRVGRSLGAMALLAAMASGAEAADFDLRSGIDIFTRSQTRMTGLHSLTFSVDIGDGFYFGESAYSAALGDAGGLFIGGFEAFKRIPLGDSSSIDIGGFVGGGGGASLISGDGLMTKAYATFNQQFAGGFVAHIGTGWTKITGSAIDSPIFTFGLSHSFDLAADVGHTDARPPSGLTAASAKAVGLYYMPISSSRRSGGGEMDPMGLVGGEFTYRDLSNPHWEYVFTAVAAGINDGSGYAEWTAGARYLTDSFLGGHLRGFVDAGVGFAGGGEVDTGSGLVGKVSAGLDAKVWGGMHLEAGAMGIAAYDGDFRAVGAFLRGAYRFDEPVRSGGSDTGGHAQHWRVATGLTYEFSHPGFRPPGHWATGSDLILIETFADLMLGKHFYVTGGGATVAGGNAGGFAIGMVGLGYQMDLGPNWALSGELIGGAAAGGGINTSPGVIGGGRVELDYKLTDNLSLSAGVGKWVSKGGAAPITLHAGIKIPFTSYH